MSLYAILLPSALESERHRDGESGFKGGSELTLGLLTSSCDSHTTIKCAVPEKFPSCIHTSYPRMFLHHPTNSVNMQYHKAGEFVDTLSSHTISPVPGPRHMHSPPNEVSPSHPQLPHNTPSASECGCLRSFMKSLQINESVLTRGNRLSSASWQIQYPLYFGCQCNTIWTVHRHMFSFFDCIQRCERSSAVHTFSALLRLTPRLSLSPTHPTTSLSPDRGVFHDCFTRISHPSPPFFSQ
jgi:hypothetical protein